MPEASFTTQFKRDLKRAKRRGKDTDKIKAVMSKLIDEEILEERYRDHALIGNYIGRREYHIEPDWLLIYKLQDDEIIFERTGTHADLFE
jgi:mRNA interferase YafQ